MDLFSKNGEYPQPVDKFRVRLPDGLTRTDPSQYTKDDEVMELLGYVKVPPMPSINPACHTLDWNGTEWVVNYLPIPEILYDISAIESVIGSTDSDSITLS